MNEPININEASFERAVIQSPIPVLVDFWAPWCGPCKMIAPLLDEIAKESDGRFRVAKVNIDDDPALMQRFNSAAFPRCSSLAAANCATRSSAARRRKRSWKSSPTWRTARPPPNDHSNQDYSQRTK